MIRLPRPDTDRRFSLANVVFATYGLFLAGFFFVPNAVDLYKFFIAAVFLPGLWLLRATLSIAWRSTIWRALLAYLLFMLLSSLWSEALSMEALWRDLRYTAYIIGFVLLTLYFFSRDESLPETVLSSVVIIAGIAVLVCISVTEPLTLLSTEPEHRWVGLGITDNANPSAFVHGLFAVVALDRIVRYRNTAAGIGFTACFMLLCTLTLLTQSNTGLLALITACALLLLMNSQHANLGTSSSANLGTKPGTSPGTRSSTTSNTTSNTKPSTAFTTRIGVALIAMGALYLSWSLGMLGGAIDIGFSARIPIWEYVLQRWTEAPFFGHGLQKVELFERGFYSSLNYAHSLFLSTARDAGLVGLLILLTVFFTALREGLRRARNGGGALYLSLICFGLVVVLVDVDQAITRPRELWIILWLPLACLIASELGLANKSADKPADAQPCGKNNAV